MHPTAEHLLDRTLELSVPLHDAIRAFDEPSARYRIADAPGVALFERDATDTVAHWSSSPVPAVVAAIEDLRPRHLERVGLPDGDDGHLPALLLACAFLADESSTVRQRLGSRVRRPADIVALDEEAGRHDPELAPHDAALRIWTPLAGADDAVYTAVLEFVFASNRKARYAPW